MPYLISKNAKIAEQNAFYEKCKAKEAVFVVCAVRTKYADIKFDSITLADQVFKYFEANRDELTSIARDIYEEFGSPRTTRPRGVGRIIDFHGLPIDLAKEITIELAKRLEALVLEVSRKLNAT